MSALNLKAVRSRRAVLVILHQTDSRADRSKDQSRRIAARASSQIRR
jgi:hypothetical protein